MQYSPKSYAQGSPFTMLISWGRCGLKKTTCSKHTLGNDSWGRNILEPIAQLAAESSFHAVSSN